MDDDEKFDKEQAQKIVTRKQELRFWSKLEIFALAKKYEITVPKQKPMQTARGQREHLIHKIAVHEVINGGKK